MQFGNIGRNRPAGVFAARNKNAEAEVPFGDHKLRSDHQDIHTELSTSDQCSYVLSGAKGQSSASLQKMLDALSDVQL